MKVFNESVEDRMLIAALVQINQEYFLLWIRFPFLYTRKKFVLYLKRGRHYYFEKARARHIIISSCEGYLCLLGAVYL